MPVKCRSKIVQTKMLQSCSSCDTFVLCLLKYKRSLETVPAALANLQGNWEQMYEILQTRRSENGLPPLLEEDGHNINNTVLTTLSRTAAKRNQERLRSLSSGVHISVVQFEKISLIFKYDQLRTSLVLLCQITPPLQGRCRCVDGFCSWSH